MPDQWVVISLDGLATAALSSYGSSWNETPAIDRLAAYGTVWDRCIIPSDDPIDVLRSFWTRLIGDLPWSSVCRKSGRTELFLNVGPQAIQLAKLAGELGFDQCTLVEAIPESVVDMTASAELEETALAKLLLPILERLSDIDSSKDQDWSLLWVHGDTLARCWDAPRILFPIDDTDEYEDDAPIDHVEWSLEDFEKDVVGSTIEIEGSGKPPQLFESVAVPRFAIPAEAHPDLVTSWMQTYGCQLRLLDRLVALLLQTIEATNGKIGLALLGTSGFSLGQNGWIGHRAGPIRSPQIHVPAILFDGQGHGIRVSDVRSVTDIAAWLRPTSIDHKLARMKPVDWACLDPDQQASTKTASIRADRVLTTNHWFFVREEDQASLFLKPDDRDDSNDVADRCREVVETMEASATR